MNQKNGKVTESTKQYLSATFQSRGLLSSRSRVTPSSRRKATVDALRRHKRKTGGQPVTNDLSQNILFQLRVENFVENTILDCDFS
ncbi:MAG TPA: hypothetical protein DCE08_04360 [Ruminococcaceae bacterium]|nr:hypothetical protein [Oscillospiraceae bacterium]